MYTCAHLRMSMHMCAHVRMCMHMCADVCIRVHMYVYVAAAGDQFATMLWHAMYGLLFALNHLVPPNTTRKINFK